MNSMELQNFKPGQVERWIRPVIVFASEDKFPLIIFTFV